MADRFLDVPRPMSEMNITPLIDVLLVLLVMLILTVPLQTHQIPIALPTVIDGAPKPDPVRNVITIGADNVIRWNGAALTQPQLRAVLRKSMMLPVEPALDLQPVAEARYALVDSVFADIKRAGVTKLGLPGNDVYREAF